MEASSINALVVYDSQYGNTELIAKAIGEAIGAVVKKPRFGELSAEELCTYDLIIIGSPTQEGKQLVSIKILLDTVPEEGLKDKKVAAFDTRHKWKVVRIFGYAAYYIADVLKRKGGNLIAPPEGFFVDSTKGPLIDGEIERAAAWSKSLAEKCV
jgi:flavodoxin